MKKIHVLFLVSLLLIGFGFLLTPKAQASWGFSNSDPYTSNGYYNYDYNDDCIQYAFDGNCGRPYYNNLNNGYNSYSGYTNYNKHNYSNNYEGCPRYAFDRNCGNTSYYNNSSSYNGYYNNYGYGYVNGYTYSYDNNYRYNNNDSCNYYRC